MATYTQGNDYQTYQVNPYQLPTQQIVQAIQTRNQYWDIGASQLKNTYQNYLNLDLTRKDNKDKLDSLMQTANNQLKQSTRADLSIAGNVNDAMTAFEPIYKNDDIMGDNTITKHYKNQLAVADSYRTRDNGKGYSDLNVRYLQGKLQDYANDPLGGTSSNWRKYYNQKANYTPFHDVGAETHALLKDYKPTVYTKSEPILDKQGKPTGYFRKVVDKEQTQAELNSYLQSNLSDEAKNQMRINGSVLFNKDYGAIGKQIYYDNSGRINTINKQLSKLSTDLLSPKASSEEKAQIQSQIDGLNSDLSDYKDQNGKIKSGDFSFIKDNYETYAGSTYAKSYVSGVASANARKLEFSDTLSADEVALTVLRESNKFKIEQMREDFQSEQNNLDRQIALLKIKNTAIKPGLKPDGTPDPNTIPSELLPKQADETGNVKQDYLNWEKERTDNKRAQLEATDSWKDYVTLKASQSGINTKDKVALDRYIETFEKNNPEDPTYKSYKSKVESYEFKNKTLEYIGNKVNDQLNTDYKNKIDSVKSQAAKYGKNVQELVDASVNGTLFIPTAGLPTNSYGDLGNFRTVSIKGKDKVVSYNDIKTVVSLVGPLSEDIQSKREALLSGEYTRFQGYREFTDKENVGFKKVQDNATRSLGMKDADITIRGYDRQGRLYVQLNNETKRNDLVKSLSRLNQGLLNPTEAYKADKDLFVIGRSSMLGFKLNTVSDPKIQALKDIAEFEAEKDPHKNSYFVQPKDWPLQLGEQYYKFEMHYVDGKQYWYPIHLKSGVKLREENGGYETLEQAAAELSNKDNQKTIRQIILSKKPDFKF
jgi:hypothetical protein